MHKLWAVLVLVLGLLALIGNVALAGNHPNFKGKGAGTTIVTFISDQQFEAESSGSLSATGLGNATYYASGIGDWITATFPDNPCASFEGNMTVTVANGDQLIGTIDAGSRQCQDAPYDNTSYSSNLLWFVTGGTGRFEGAQSLNPIGIVVTSSGDGLPDPTLNDSLRLTGQLSY
jgi:hypothetical protein